jgi:hypothetical protein
MRASQFVAMRRWRSLAIPLAMSAPPLLWVAEGLRRSSLTPLGRDQGIFQYIGWALRRGEVDYRDFRDVNGPLTHLVHWLFLGLGGSDEHRFRVLDLLFSSVSFAFVGACVPGLRSAPPRTIVRTPDLLERAAWGIAGWVVLSGQYLQYDFWHSAQRESFFDWFMLPSVALQLFAQAPSGGFEALARRRQALVLVLAGGLSVIPWFGKPTYALFTMAQIFALLADPMLLLSRPWALAAFGSGALAAASLGTGLLAAYGDLFAFARIQLVDVPASYRFIWARKPLEVFATPWTATQAALSMAGAAAMLALIVLRRMPARAIGVALVPVCGLVSVVVQAKGFQYHFHPVTAGVYLQWLVCVAWLAERSRVSRRDRALVRLVPLAAALAVALRVVLTTRDSSYLRAAWLRSEAATAEERSLPEYFAHFPEPDFFPYSLRQTAAYLRSHTRPTDRVQTYGMDPYVLFLARRESATPYIYGYDLDADAALAGGTGARPDPVQSARIRAIRAAHEMDLLARVQAQPPAAFVFIDGAPLLSRADAWADFVDHCRQTATWVGARYREAARFGPDHIWLRIDLFEVFGGTISPNEAAAQSAP